MFTLIPNVPTERYYNCIFYHTLYSDRLGMFNCIIDIYTYIFERNGPSCQSHIYRKMQRCFDIVCDLHIMSCRSSSSIHKIPQGVKGVGRINTSVINRFQAWRGPCWLILWNSGPSRQSPSLWLINVFNISYMQDYSRIFFSGKLQLILFSRCIFWIAHD